MFRANIPLPTLGGLFRSGSVTLFSLFSSSFLRKSRSRLSAVFFELSFLGKLFRFILLRSALFSRWRDIILLRLRMRTVSYFRDGLMRCIFDRRVSLCDRRLSPCRESDLPLGLSLSTSDPDLGDAALRDFLSGAIRGSFSWRMSDCPFGLLLHMIDYAFAVDTDEAAMIHLQPSILFKKTVCKNVKCACSKLKTKCV